MSKTKTSVRIFIGFMAFLMIVSTLGLYIVIILGNKNQSEEQTAANQAQIKLNDNIQIQQSKSSTKAAELSKQYYTEFVAYKNEVKSFNAASVTELKTRDLRAGDGAEVKEDFTDYSMYYIGWLPNETIFDSSISNDALAMPLPGSGSYITGWNEGVIGMKVGGIREITIPSDKAYGTTGAGEEGQDGYIAPNTPLKFIVMAIPKVDSIPFSKGTYELCLQVNKPYVDQYGKEAVDQYLCGAYGNEEK
ncbi:MAG: FKBP-type peptidyl-prolyl cis-trans isomerase [Candidatus Nomurabacteria bacterium]|jgi:FKBP-type peptidyl-prolyl cis-trans isomerase|nr:FKBP-type peptidyl-prolyl cis-trans isomerase [Candidatus Nomurabacteria bacterium]